MDLLSVLAIGLTSASITLVGLAISFKLFKSRLEDAVLGSMEQFIVGFIAKAAENPKELATTLKPILNAMIGELIPPELMEKVNSVPAGMLGQIAPLLPRKFQKYAGLIQLVQGFGSGSQKEPNSNPLGSNNNSNKSPFS